MTNSSVDEIPLPHFEDRLWSELARLHAEEAAAAEVTPVTDRRVTVSPLRRRARRSLVAGLGITAVAGLVIAAVVVRDPDPSPDVTPDGVGPPRADVDTGPQDGPPPGADSAGGRGLAPLGHDIEAQMIAAIDTAIADAVVHQVPLGATAADAGEIWIDERSGAIRILLYDSTGAPLLDSGPAVAPATDAVGPAAPPGAEFPGPSWPTELTRQVDHCFGEYVELPRPRAPARNEAQVLRDQLARGLTFTDGTETVDGRELLRVFSAIELTEEVVRDPETFTPPPDSGMEVVPGGGAVVLRDHVVLVDPATYRPVMAVAGDGSPGERVTRLDYLPRTAETLALLTPPVPDGFVPVDVPRGDAELLERCGM